MLSEKSVEFVGRVLDTCVLQAKPGQEQRAYVEAVLLKLEDMRGEIQLLNFYGAAITLSLIGLAAILVWKF